MILRCHSHALSGTYDPEFLGALHKGRVQVDHSTFMRVPYLTLTWYKAHKIQSVSRSMDNTDPVTQGIQAIEYTRPRTGRTGLAKGSTITPCREWSLGQTRVSTVL